MSRRQAGRTGGMLAGTGGWVTAASLLVFACVFLAVFGPRASLGMRTRALRQSLAHVTPLARSVYGYAGYTDFSAGVRGQVTASRIAEAGTLLTRNLASAGLPLAPRAGDWSGMWTGFATIAGGAPKAREDSRQRPLIELAYRDALAGHARLASGRWPNGVHAAGRWLFFEVAVTAATAARFGLHAGSVLHLGSGLALNITGILQAARPASPFWTADPLVLKPRLHINENAPSYWTAGAFAGPAEVPWLASRFDVSTISLSWDFPLNLDRLTASQAESLAHGLSRAALSAGQLHSASGLISDLPRPITLRAGLSDPLTRFTQQDAAIASVLDLLFVSLTLVGTVVLLLGARLLAQQRTRELSLLRARGASLRQLGTVMLRPVAMVTIPAALAGAGCAVALTRGYGTPLAWWLGVLTAGAALAGPPLFAIREHRRALPSPGARADAPVSRRAAARRAVAEGALIAAAAGGLVLLRRQGEPASGGVDLYSSMTPALIAIPAAVVLMRVYPAAVRKLLRLAGKRRGVIAFVGLAQASRTSLTAILPVFALILALAVIAFGTMLSGAVNRGEVAASWQRTGADAIVDLAASARPLSAAARHAISDVPGVTRTTAVAVDAGTSAQGILSGVTITVVDPASYANFAAATPGPAFPAAKLARGRSGHSAGRTVSVLATPAAASTLGRGTRLVDIALRPMRIRIAGTISRVPGVSSNAMVVVPDWAFGTSGPGGPLPRATRPNLLLVAGAALDRQRLATLVRRLLPGSVITFRSTALAALASAPLPHGAYLAFAAGAAGAAVLSVVILLIMLLLGARPRALTLSRLETMGLRQGQARWLAAVEVAPQVFAAAAGGVLCAIALAPLIGPSIDLSPFTGSGASVPIRAEPVPLAAVTTGLAILAVLTVAAQACGAYLRGAARLLRIDDG